MGKSVGVHLIMDGFVRDSASFTKENILSLFDKIISALEMKALDKAHIYEIDTDPEILKRVELTGNFEDEGGITGVIVISTSHISIHCWPLQRLFRLDAFSCKSFNADLAEAIIRNSLGVSDANTTVINRRLPLSLASQP